MRRIKIFSGYDFVILGITVFLIIWGIINIYSATINEYHNLYIKQALYGSIGILILLLMPHLNYRKIISLAPVIYILGVILLISVIFFGTTVLGAKRWLSFGFFTLQPSELMKFVLIITTAYILGLKGEGLSLKKLSVVIFLALLPSILIVKQPDLGTAVTVLIPVFAMVFVYGIHRKYILTFSIFLILISPFVWDHLKEYQKKRILAFINPESDPFKSAYHILQSKIAIGSGQLTGKGFLEGTQSKLFFLPEQHTDFIFSTIGEEWGFVVSSIIVLMYLVVGVRILKWSLRIKDLEGRFVCVGAGTLITLQAFINIAMTVGLAPVVGITLPFLSYGGSSLITFSMIMGLVLGIIRDQKTKSLQF